jgi:hypothetical protein
MPGLNTLAALRAGWWRFLDGATLIVDVLIDTERWLHLHKLFRPLMGTESRIEELRQRVISTLFCYGCNPGPTQTARSIRGMSRKQIAWLNIKYVTEDVLEKAIVKVINAYNKFELPSYWGWASTPRPMARNGTSISCGTYEGTYILDGLMTNTSDICGERARHSRFAENIARRRTDSRQATCDVLQRVSLPASYCSCIGTDVIR